MSAVTTIKVSKQLRDRLAARAQLQHVTLGTVIARALDESEERSFWSAVAKEHGALTAAERQGYLPDDTLQDSHVSLDDALGLQDEW